LNELLDSLLSDAIPYLVKKHYFNLLFEVYLRKVPGVNNDERIQISNYKLQALFKYVICWDIDQKFHHYHGLVIEEPLGDDLDSVKQLRATTRGVKLIQEQDYEDYEGASSKEEKI